MLKARIFIQDNLTSFRMIPLGFIFVIFTGALLLCLPFASTGKDSVGLLDAVFTSTSATCVTGLVVFDTATKWTLFGRTVILILIQIGGLGVVTAGVALLSLTGIQIGLLPRIAVQDSLSALQIGGVVRFMRFLIAGTFLFEGIGALCLFPTFAAQFGLLKGLGHAVFHSVSAFCNAGFDLMGSRQQFSSLTYYSGNISVNVVIMLLIILGGLGFVTWSDLLSCRFSFKQLRLQSKLILVTTAVLLLLPFLWFYFLEFRTYSGKERLLYSLFQSVTPRTAGFNTFDYGKMSEGGLLITILLMITGGAPGSTAGGMKVTTAAVLIISARSFLRRKEHVNCFRRRIEPEVIHNAMTLITVYLLLLLSGTLILATLEDIPILPSMFECASALGTVGLTTGITSGLGTVPKIVLISFMFFGRMGGITLGYALVSRTHTNIGRLPLEKVNVG